MTSTFYIAKLVGYLYLFYSKSYKRKAFYSKSTKLATISLFFS